MRITILCLLILIAGCSRSVMMVHPETHDKKLCQSNWSPMGGAIAQGAGLSACVDAWKKEGYQKK